jgi:hypothetical protein
MGSVARALAALAVAAGTWCALGSLAVFSPTGAAARVGVLPPWWVAAAALVLAGTIAWRVRGVSSRALPLLLLPLFLLPWLPVAVPAATLLFTGRLAWGLLALTLVAVAVAGHVPLPRFVSARVRDPRRAPWLAAACALALFLWGGHHLQGMVPGGDEPHYLVITQSLLHDRDLKIENNHLRGDYAPYFKGTLRPDYLRRGQDQQIYSIHAPGISALVLPAFAIGGYPGVVVFLSLLCALGTGLAWWLAWRVTADAAAAWFGWASVTLAVPFTVQAFSVYPDATASVIALTGVAALVLPTARPPVQWLLHGVSLALLPWLHTRHSVLAGVLGAFIVLRVLAGERPIPRLAAFAAGPVVSAIGWFWYFWSIYGTLSPSAPYGGVRNTTSFAFLPVTIPGLLFDQQFGLFATAPALLVACLGLVVLARRRPNEWAMAPDANGRWLAGALAVLLVAYTVAAGTYRMWWAGSSSPARFLVPLVLALSVPAAAFWAGARRRASRVVAAGALAVTALLSAVFLGVDHGRLAFNFRDGYALLCDWLSPAADLSEALPSLIRDPLTVAAWRIVAWLGAALLCWAAVAFVDATSRPARGVLGLTALWAGAVGAAAAATISWAVGGAGVTLRPHTSQLEFVQRLDKGSRHVGVRLDPALTFSRPLTEARRFRLETSTRRRLPAGELLVLVDLPAGRYRFRADPVPAGGTTSVALGRGPALAEWPAEALGAGVDFDLPIRARALVLRTDAAEHATRVRAWAEPLTFDGPEVSVPGRAATAARYGRIAVFGLEGESYVESGGVWTRSTVPADLVVSGPPGEPRIEVSLSGGPLENVCRVEASGRRDDVALAPGESRDLTLPVPADGRLQLRVTASRDFSPADVEPGNADQRHLGCRIEFR